ncbi:class I SAM-dependent methyltransferase [Vogesella sp. LIG4]|uniref:class I SAM-dependent methyltransferase n=1 Tax=Vogesella sp. LIG4 TaxID=1192162 RepID=UPI00081FE97E|nr:class I SAM-dependent methyltransferase [Vogesella sp. LIG4]SCK25043.1 hypothetical protein PSELUDRAFT_2962 [Vogesella sp. LIG4]
MRVGVLLRPVLTQLLAALLAWFFVAPLQQPWTWAGLQALLVLLLARLQGMNGLALLLQALLAPAVLLASHWQLPPWLYLAGLLLLLALSRNALTERVPLYLSSSESIGRLADMLPQGARVLDLGSGDGRVVLQLAASRHDLQLLGIENALLPWLWSRIRYLLAGRPANARLRYGSFWQQNWADFDVVHAFLSPAPMARVWQQFQQQCHPDAILVSNSFMIEGVLPVHRLALSGPLQTELLIWRHPHGTC